MYADTVSLLSRRHKIISIFRIGKILNDQTDPMKTERISDTVGRPSVIKLKYETLTTQDAANLRTSIRKPDNVSDEFWKFFVIQTVCGLLQVCQLH